MGPQIRPSAPLVHAKNSTKHNTFCILEPKRPLFDANGHSQAPAYAISCENTKSSVWHKENLHLLPAMHSIFDHILPTCGAKFHCEPLSLLTLRLWVRPVPSPKPFKNVDGEHRAGPWLTQCNKIMQKSVDFNRLLLFNPGRGVFATSFWSPTGSSASCVCLKLWNHQFSFGKTNGSHSALLGIHHLNRQLGLGLWVPWHSKSVSKRSTWRPLGLSK